MPLLDDLDPAPQPAPVLTDLDPAPAPAGGGLLNDLDPLVDQRKARNARVQADQQAVGLAHTPASDSAAARQEQLATGKAFDPAHPADPLTAARMRGEPVMEAYDKPNAAVTYGKALGLGVAKDLTKLNLALRLNRLVSGNTVGDEDLKSVLDSFETAPGAAPLPGREASAAVDSVTGWNPDGAGTILPGSRTVEGVGETLPTMALAGVPYVGPELYAATSGEEVRQEGIREGMDPQEALARGAAAALGSEVGFRGVPKLAPELAKLSPVQDVAPAAAAGGKGSFTGRLAEGGLMGEAQDLTTPQEDPSQQRSLAPAAAMAVVAGAGGRVRGPVHNTEGPVLAGTDIDPAAETQTDLRPVMQGPETQEFKVFQAGEGPADHPVDDTPEERAADIARSQEKLDTIKRIRGTGEPVVGGIETREIDPQTVRDAVDTEDAVKTAVEGAPDQLMRRSPEPATETRQGDTQDAIATRPDGFSVFPKEEPDYPTHMTQEVSPGERAYMEALSDNVGKERTAAEGRARALRPPTDEQRAAARAEFDKANPEVAFEKPGDELGGRESPVAPPAEEHAEPAQPTPARSEVPASALEPKAEGRPAPASSVANDLAGGGFRRRGAAPSDVPTGRVTINGREGTIVPGAPKGHTRVRFTNGKQAVVPEEIVHGVPPEEVRPDAHVRADARPVSEGAPEAESAVQGADEESGAPASEALLGRHALRGQTPEARRLEKAGRREGPDLHEGKTVKEVDASARKQVREGRSDIAETIRQRSADRENFRDETERRAAQLAVAQELHEATLSRDPQRIAQAQELARHERAVASLAGATLRHSARDPRKATPRERHEILTAHLSDAHGNGGMEAKIRALETERDALRAKLGPHTTDGTEPPKAAPKPFTPNQRRSKLTRKKAALNEDFKALAKALVKNLSGKGPSNALGGRVLDLIYQMLENRVKHGAVSFADAVLAISDHVLAMRHNPEAHAAMDDAWKRLMERHPEAEAPEGTAADIIENDPRQSLEARLERMDKYYKSLEEHYQSYHDQLAAMTPEQRTEFLAGEAANAELPPELQKLREEGAARLKVLRERIKTLDGSTGKSPSLQEQLDEEGRRQANLHGRLEAERQRLAGMTPEEIAAEKRTKGPSPEIADIRKEAADRRAPLLKELERLRNQDAPVEADQPSIPEDVLAHQKALGRIETKLRALKDENAKKYQKVVDRMAKRGFPMDDPDAAWLKDPSLVPAFLDDLDAVTHGGVGPVLGEIYRGMLHASSTVLQMKGVTDVLNFATEELGNLVSRRPAETLAALKGWGPGVVDGFRNAWGSLRWERDRWADQFDDGSRGYEGTGHRVIGGGVGRAFRLANLITPVAAINAMASSIVARMEQGAQAYRLARKQGRTGQELSDFMEAQAKDYHSESWEAAKRVTDRRMLLGKNALSKLINQAKNLKTESAAVNTTVKTGATILSPFSLIPLNNLKEGFLTRTPVVSTIGALYRYYQHRTGANPDFRWSKEVAEHVLTWGAAIGIYKLAVGTNSMGMPLVTGFSDKKNPTSVYYDGHYVNYSKFGPWAHGVGNMVDMMRAYHQGKPWGDYFDAAKKHITEEALFKSLSDLDEAFSNHTENDKRTFSTRVAKYAANLTTSFVPSYVKQVTHAREDHVEKLTDRDPSKSFGASYVEDVRRNLGYGQIPFQYDTWGEPLLKDAFDGRPNGTFWYRVAVPARLGENLAQKNRLDFLIADYNEKHPAESDQLTLQPPDRSVREGQPYPDGSGGVAGGKKYTLSDKQVEEALRIGGHQAKDQLLNSFAGKQQLSPIDAVVLKKDYNTWIDGVKKLIAVRDDEQIGQKYRDKAKASLEQLGK